MSSIFHGWDSFLQPYLVFDYHPLIDPAMSLS